MRAFVLPGPCIACRASNALWGALRGGRGPHAKQPHPQEKVKVSPETLLLVGAKDSPSPTTLYYDYQYFCSERDYDVCSAQRFTYQLLTTLRSLGVRWDGGSCFAWGPLPCIACTASNARQAMQPPTARPTERLGGAGPWGQGPPTPGTPVRPGHRSGLA